jgi:PAS domain-containing protein
VPRPKLNFGDTDAFRICPSDPRVALGSGPHFPSAQASRHDPNEGIDALYRTAALVESSEDPIIGLTLEGLITNWNPAAERL